MQIRRAPEIRPIAVVHFTIPIVNTVEELAQQVTPLSPTPPVHPTLTVDQASNLLLLRRALGIPTTTDISLRQRQHEVRNMANLADRLMANARYANILRWLRTIERPDEHIDSVTALYFLKFKMV